MCVFTVSTHLFSQFYSVSLQADTYSRFTSNMSRDFEEQHYANLDEK